MTEPQLPTELHNSLRISKGVAVLKVHGGYIYTICQLDEGQMNSVFVPEP